MLNEKFNEREIRDDFLFNLTKLLADDILFSDCNDTTYTIVKLALEKLKVDALIEKLTDTFYNKGINDARSGN